MLLFWVWEERLVNMHEDRNKWSVAKVILGCVRMLIECAVSSVATFFRKNFAA